VRSPRRTTTHSLSAAFALLLGAKAFALQSPALVQGKIGLEADRFLEGCVPFGFSGSVLIVIDGQAVLRKGYGSADPEHAIPNSASTLFDIGSLTKQFTATAILLLEAKGKLSTQDPIARHLSDVPPDKQAITIHHLLTHTSGIAGTLTTIGSLTIDREEMLRKVFEAPLEAPPGARFHYSNTGYGVLAAIVEKTSGFAFERFLTDNLFAPAGMKHTGFCQQSNLSRESIAIGFEDSRRIGSAVDGWYSWALRGAGGVLSSIEDMEKWEDALAGRSFLAKEVRAKLYVPALETYAYGWRVRKDERGKLIAEHGGTTRGFEAKYRRQLEENASIVILANNRDLGPSIPVALDHIAHGERYSVPPKLVRLEAKALAALAGKYVLSANSGVEMRATEQGVSLSAFGQDAVDALLMQQPDPEKCARMTSAATRLVEAMESAREDGVTELLKPGHFPDGRALVVSWKSLTEQNGALKSWRTLGCASYSDGGGACYLRLVFDKKEETLRLGWSADRIDGVHYDDKLPFEKRFLPESPKNFVSFELTSLWARQRIAFEIAKDGKVAACVLRNLREELRFERAAK
jgi:CubicO group peptidase (beta-lactamase class C family)